MCGGCPHEIERTPQECSRRDFVVTKFISGCLYHCTNYGLTNPRDVNAALVILSRGSAQTAPPRKGFLEPVMAEVAGSHLLSRLENVSRKTG